MCYSAMVRAEYRKYTKEYGANLSLPEYVREYWEQMGDEWVRKMPSAFRAWFRGPGDKAKAGIGEAIEDWTLRQIPEWEAELAKQVDRLAVNEAKLQRKVTKTAQEEVRKATGGNRDAADAGQAEHRGGDGSDIPAAGATWATPIADACRLAEINSAPRLATFLAQVGHESAGLSHVVENLNYSADAIRNAALRSKPGSRWSSLGPRAAQLARNPQALANAAYGGRMRNRDEASGDGCHCCNRNNYQRWHRRRTGRVGSRLRSTDTAGCSRSRTLRAGVPLIPAR